MGVGDKGVGRKTNFPFFHYMALRAEKYKKEFGMALDPRLLMAAIAARRGVPGMVPRSWPVMPLGSSGSGGMMGAPLGRLRSSVAPALPSVVIKPAVKRKAKRKGKKK